MLCGDHIATNYTTCIVSSRTTCMRMNAFTRPLIPPKQSPSVHPVLANQTSQAQADRKTNCTACFLRLSGSWRFFAGRSASDLPVLLLVFRRAHSVPCEHEPRQRGVARRGYPLACRGKTPQGAGWARALDRLRILYFRSFKYSKLSFCPSGWVLP